nr:small nuclear ribonucleoprotein-associated protein B [Cryptomonas curvata]
MFLNQIKKNTKVKIVLKNKKILKGVIVSYDNYMNIILDNCEEYKCKNEKGHWEFRKIGFCLLRGDMIVLISKEK